jgi:N-dimethylarginine dimethylaminohydrolase
MSPPADHGGQSMCGRLRRVLVCSPAAAGWGDPDRAGRWRGLGYHRPPAEPAARAEHDELRRLLAASGAEILSLPESEALPLDAVYTHDASFVTDRGAVLMRMGKEERRREPERHALFYRSAGIPLIGAIEPPGTLEGGDIVWLDRSTLLVGRGYRSNREGIEQLRAIVGVDGIEVLEAPLPHGEGPAACLHLMSLMSILGDRVAVVDPSWMSVATVELLQQRGFDMIPIEAAERGTMAANILALGERRLVALADNRATNRRLEERGFAVARLTGRAVAHNGSGGPTCLTRPILRD